MQEKHKKDEPKKGTKSPLGVENARTNPTKAQMAREVGLSKNATLDEISAVTKQFARAETVRILQSLKGLDEVHGTDLEGKYEYCDKQIQIIIAANPETDVSPGILTAMYSFLHELKKMALEVQGNEIPNSSGIMEHALNTLLELILPYLVWRNNNLGGKFPTTLEELRNWEYGA